MGSFGEKLRREREMRGISLDSIAEATKIGTRSLRALEDENFEQLPGGIFNKGFVRAYAKYLGLNEDQAVAEYLEAAGESSPDPHLIAEQNAVRIERGRGSSGGHKAVGFPIVPVIILLVVIGAGAGGWEIYQQRQHKKQAREEAARAQSLTNTPTPGALPNAGNPVAGEPATTEVPAGATTPDATGTVSKQSPATAPTEQVSPATPADLNSIARSAGTADVHPATPSLETGKPVTSEPTLKPAAPEPSGAARQSFEVTVRAKDRAWVSIKSDGKVTVRGIINPSDVKTVHAMDQIVFWTGNAGAVEISFNGQIVPLRGGPNTEGVLVFNPRGVVVPKPAAATPEP